MGGRFGELDHNVRGVITFGLSPYELRPFAGFFKKGFPNMFRRFNRQVFIITPPFVLAYLLYDWGEKEHERSKRKDMSLYMLPGEKDE